MSRTAIRVRNLSKRYRIGALQQRQATNFRELLSSAALNTLRTLSRGRNGASHTRDEDLWSLQDVSFEAEAGKVLGVIGRNGAGKSTLLKILARITHPTSGRVEINGRLGSLLEVGTGFHPELSGRDNISLAGAVLGMRSEEIRRQFDAIVEFAEIRRFLDTPVKRYSSGMYMRLAFAVAAHFEPDIIVIDEVLAVGDASFQQKCINRMHRIAGNGRTVLFVSHNMSAIRALCDRVIVLDAGSIVEDTTDVDKAIGRYAQTAQGASSWRRAAGEIPAGAQLIFSKLNLTLAGKQPGHRLIVRAELLSQEKHQPAFLAFDIVDSSLTPIMQALPDVVPYIGYSNQPIELETEIDLPPLIPGVYRVSAWVGPHNTKTYDQVEPILEFRIESSPDAQRSFPHTSDHGFVVPTSRINAQVRTC
jgi:lipopolysaccharide transport system ATP-binding protein